MKRLSARTLRKSELRELLAQAVRDPALERQLGCINEIWRLPDGRVIDIFALNGPANLWPNFEELRTLYEEAQAEALEHLARRKRGSGGATHALAGYFDENSFHTAEVEAGLIELFSRLGLKRSAQPFSDEEVSSLSTAVRYAAPHTHFEESDVRLFVLYVGECVRTRRRGEWITRHEEGAVVPYVRCEDGTVVDPWSAVFDEVEGGDFPDGDDLPDIKGIVDMLLLT